MSMTIHPIGEIAPLQKGEPQEGAQKAKAQAAGQGGDTVKLTKPMNEEEALQAVAALENMAGEKSVQQGVLAHDLDMDRIAALLAD